MATEGDIDAQVVLYNQEKGYGLIRSEGQEVFFALAGVEGAVELGDEVQDQEDHLMIEGQTCAFNVKKLE